MRGTDTPRITVAVRKRPMNKKELQRSQNDIVRVSPQGQVVMSEYKQKVDLTKYLEETTFDFDYAYDERSNNDDIYEQSVRPLIENAFQGAKISCFAYGQTGSGKTYTMKGDMGKGIPGIYYLGAKEIFRYLEQPQYRSMQIVVTFFEIYCGKLYDLLSNRNLLKILEDSKGNINVIGLNEKVICSPEEFLDLIEEGSGLRITSQNNTNNDSSRSHAILQISIKERRNTFSKISFIDLAGNERGADHMDQNKQTKIDGAEINRSLLQLKECIRALDQGKGHVPFRGSKLTMVLKDSFMGNCNTVMICNISPNSTSSENTMNTLRYADRVKDLKRSGDDGDKPTREGKPTKEAMMARELMLPRANNKNCVKVNIDRGDDEEDIMMKMNMARGIQENNEPTFLKYEEKMDIEEPKPISQYGRKTDFQPNNTRSFGGDRMMTGKDVGAKSRGNLNQIGQFRGRDLGSEADKQPLRNVHRQKIDQNNFNQANGGLSHDHSKPSKLFSQNSTEFPSNQFAANRSHFDAMNKLRSGFELYRQDYQKLINQETNLLRGELIMNDEYRQVEGRTHAYEEEIGNVNMYLNEMERIIREKEQVLNAMKNNNSKMRVETRHAQSTTAQLRYEQGSNEASRGANILSSGNSGPFGAVAGGSRNHNRLHVHSSLNGMNFNGFNGSSQFCDEQLLEGLGEQARLF